MSGGVIFGTMFFLLVTFAAITSAISLIEPALAWLVEHLHVSRLRGAILVGGVAWFVGLGSAFSTNIWSDVMVLPGMDFFTSMDYVSNNIMLPLGGMLIALFSGWAVDKSVRTNYNFRLDSLQSGKSWFALLHHWRLVRCS